VQGRGATRRGTKVRRRAGYIVVFAFAVAVVIVVVVVVVVVVIVVDCAD